MADNNEHKEEQFIRKMITEHGLSKPTEGFVDRVAEKIEAAPLRSTYKPVMSLKVRIAAMLFLLIGLAASLYWEPSGKYHKYTEMINWDKLITFSEQFSLIFVSVFTASVILFLIDRILSKKLFRRRFFVW